MINTTPLRKKLLDLAFSGKLVPKTGEWKTVKLGEVCDIVTGATPSTKVREYFSGPIPFIKPADLGVSDYVETTSETLSEIGAQTVRKIPSGSICVCCIGSLGKASISAKESCTNQQINSLIPKSCLESNYLYYYVLSERFQDALKARASAVTIALVNKSKMSGLEIPLPPLAEQRAIVSRLEELLALEKSIAEDAAAIDDLIAAAKRKILDLAVAGKLVKKQGEWLNARLGDLCEYGKCIGVDPDSLDANTWVLDLEDIEKDTGRLLVRVSAKDRKSTSTKHGFKKGTLLYSKLRTYLNKVLIAPEDGCCTSEILPLVFDDRVVPAYARIVLMSPMFLDYTATCCYGVKMPRLGTNDGKRGPFPLPPLAEQHAIVAKVEKLFAALDAMKGL